MADIQFAASAQVENSAEETALVPLPAQLSPVYRSHEVCEFTLQPGSHSRSFLHRDSNSTKSVST